MRLAVVVPTFPTRVTSAELWLAEGLAELGHEVVVYSSGREGARKDRGWSGGASPEPPWVRKFRVREISTVTVGYAEASVPLRVGPIFADRPDAILLQEDYPPLSQFVARGARRRLVPYLLTSERYTDLSPWLARTVVRAFDRWLLPNLWRKSRAITLHSTAARRFLLERGAPAERLHYIPASTDTDHFSPRPSGASRAVEALWPDRGSSVRLLSAARLYPAKGLETFVTALGRLRTDSPPTTTLIRGRGPLEAKLRAGLSRGGLASTVRIDGTPLPPSDLPALYRSGDVYVQPSLVEPFGMATLEAMACGLPVVASQTGGLADLVQDQVNGLLVPPKDPNALAVAIRRLCTDVALRQQMGKASRLRAVAIFGKEPVAKSFDRLLQDSPA